MVTVTLGGGLGNQLFQYSLARQLALKNNTSLKLYINNIEKEPGRTYKLQHYNIQEQFASEAEVEKLIGTFYEKSFYARAVRKLNTYLPKYNRSYFIEKEYYCYEPAVFQIKKNVLLEGFWQHYKYFENFPTQILDEITLKEKYKLTTSESLNQIDQDVNSVSIHIRRGDYISDENNLNFFGVLPLDYYRQAVNYMTERIWNVNFYIFSDDLNWAKDNLNINAPVYFMDIDNGTKDYLELDAMSRCRHNIIANSSFSWWAAYLNRNTEKIVIAPEKWVADPTMNNRINLQLPSWIKI